MRALLATNEVSIVSRLKNKEFDRRFNLKHTEKIKILKSLTVDDCTKIEFNRNTIYPIAELYFFIKDVNILSYGEKEQISLYIKMYIDTRDSYDHVIVISFHPDGEYDE